ncbi:hypothetical protein BGZ83_008480 [Gryganskiella cystojenkinii]|nr:hypothetical protein BGZ83_008480 [Gryganskiella cystojenkinii]
MFASSAAVGPLSAPSSPSFPNSTSTLPGSPAPPSSFMVMHGSHSNNSNTGTSGSLYEPFRRNSVPILTVDQAEHKRKISEEKHMQRQGSWSSLSSSASSNSLMGGPIHHHGIMGVPPPGLHHLDAAHLDPATMHYYRTQFSQQHVFQPQQHQQHHLHMQQHSLNQVMPSSPMPGDSFNTITNGGGHHSHHHHQHSSSSSSSNTGAIRSTSSAKVKRNNSICSTTSVSSSSSGSNNKHPCKFPSCEWSFKRYEHLKRHMLVHTKERPFQCEFAGCNKSFSRSDNFSAHLRTHSKKALAHRRYESRGLDGTGNGPSIKQESQDPNGSLSEGSMAGFIPHASMHLPNSYSSSSISQSVTSEYGRDDYSPPLSPGGTPLNRSNSALGTSSMNDDDSFDMMGHHSGYAFGNSSMYSLDHLDHLNSMVPRFDTIRLDIKSVAPGDMHGGQYDDDNNNNNNNNGSNDTLMHNSNSTNNPNGESPRSSSPTMPQYEHFSFPPSISTHFMPVMGTGQDAQSHNQNGGGHDSMQPSSAGSYSSLPSSDSFGSSQGGYHSDSEMKGVHFSQGSNGDSSDNHYSPSPPLNSDGHHSSQGPYHHYDGNGNGNNNKTSQMMYPGVSYAMPRSASSSSITSSSAALPPHPLMSTMSSSASTPNGLSDSLYAPNSPMVTGSRAQQVKAHQRQITKLQLKQQRQAQTA